MGTLLHRCTDVCELIKLSFRVVSGVSQALMYWMGVDVLQGEAVSGSFAEFFPHSLWCIVKQKCIILVCKKLTIFLYGQDIIGNVFSLVF